MQYSQEELDRISEEIIANTDNWEITIDSDRMGKYSVETMELLSESGKGHMFHRCSACGEWHKGKYGYKYECDGRGFHLCGKVKLCNKCAKKYLPLLAETLRNLSSEIHRKESKTWAQS